MIPAAMPFRLAAFSHLFSPEFHAMTFPAYAAQLGRETFYGVEAWAGDRPVGLALANRITDSEAELLSVFVEADCRRQGLGTRLVAQLQADSRARGLRRLETVFMTGGASTPAVERILARQGWSRPSRRMLVLRTTLAAIQQATWLTLAPNLPPGFTVIPWAALDPTLKHNLALEQAASPWIPEILSPFRFEIGHDRATSMALLHDGRIRGWLLSHLIGLDSIRFSCAYVHPRAQGLARLIPMIAEAIRASEAAGYFHASWAVSYHQRRMIEFMDKHFAPWCTFRGETRGAHLVLG
jgi:GNAT superfamily N-acetyltransferase